MRQRKIFQLTAFSILAALLVLLGFTPIGSIQLPVIKATTTHIPVIVGALLLGRKEGELLGGMFGVVSVLRSTLAPSLTSFVFSPFLSPPGMSGGNWKALIVAFLPRVLLGTCAWALNLLLQKMRVKKELRWALCALLASLLHTVGVLGLIALLFHDAYCSAIGIVSGGLWAALGTVVLTNGCGEAIAAAVIVSAIMFPLDKLYHVERNG